MSQYGGTKYPLYQIFSEYNTKHCDHETILYGKLSNSNYIIHINIAVLRTCAKPLFIIRHVNYTVSKLLYKHISLDQMQIW